MSKDLIGKYCLIEITPSRAEFRSEVSVITGLHNLYPDTHVFLDNNVDSIYHIRGLLITENIEMLEGLLEMQKEYLEELNTLRVKINTLKKDHCLTVSKIIKKMCNE